MHASNPSRRHLPKPPVHHSTMKQVGLHANKMLPPPRPQRLPCAGAGAYQCAGAVTTRAMGEWTEQPQAVHHQQRTRPNNPSSMPAAVWRSRPRRPLIISLRTLVICCCSSISNGRAPASYLQKKRLMGSQSSMSEQSLSGGPVLLWPVGQRRYTDTSRNSSVFLPLKTYRLSDQSLRSPVFWWRFRSLVTIFLFFL
jgi:hypothetical protein